MQLKVNKRTLEVIKKPGGNPGLSVLQICSHVYSYAKVQNFNLCQAERLNQL
jgi:hypothetical protein